MATVHLSTPAELYTLMLSPGQTSSYILDNDIDMSSYTSLSIDQFAGNFDGGGHTISIGPVDPGYLGFFYRIINVFNSTTINNLTIKYTQAINLTLTGGHWGGLIAWSLIATSFTVSNCNCIYMDTVQLISPINNTYASLLFGQMTIPSPNITNCNVIINAGIRIVASNQSCLIGLLFGGGRDFSVSNCSVVANSGAYNIILDVRDIQCYAGLLIGLITNTVSGYTYNNISGTFNNNGNINILQGPTPNTCGAMIGANERTAESIQINNMTININNNQSLNQFPDFFGEGTIIATGAIFTYPTTTDNTSRPLTIVPAPTPAPVTYINSYANTYPSLPIGNYYMPGITSFIELNPTIRLDSLGPDGINIDLVLYPTGSIYTFTDNTGTTYDLTVFGVGSMYFGIKLNIPPEAIAAIEACSCDINAVVNPQTGITADSRIVNALQANQIRSSVDQEILTQYVGYPKFKTYRDYALYIQGKLRYR